MRQKGVAPIIILVILILITIFILIYITWLKRQNVYLPELNRFPPPSIEQDREAAKKLPKEECSCWDGTNNICLPIGDCI